jgi:predicted nucleic acid-binding protein
MFRAPFKVVLDANVLYPFTLRDTLLRAGEEEFYQLYWSDEILAEVKRNLVSKGQMTEDQASRLFKQMVDQFPESMVAGYESLTQSMTNHQKDRHVVAAAVKAGAQVIVTGNLKDFRSLPDGMEAQSPDEFLGNLFDLDPNRFIALLRQQSADLKKPAVTFEDLLSRLAKSAPTLGACCSNRKTPLMRSPYR